MNNPGVSLTTLFESSADTVGVWRFLKNIKFSHIDIMKGYYDSTKKLISKLFKLLPDNEIYVIQDTSEIDLSDNKASEGLGYLADTKAFWHFNENKKNLSISKEESLANFKKFVKKGVYLHSSLACTIDGEPIGLTYQEQIVRDFDNPGTRRVVTKSIEERESFKWIESVNQTLNLNLKQDITFIADREADIFEVFTYDYKKVNEKQKVNFVIRATSNRIVTVDINNKEEKFKLKELSESIPNEFKFTSTQTIPRSRERDEKEVTMDISFTTLTIKGKKLFKPTKIERSNNGEATHSKPEYHKDLKLNVVIVENKLEKLEWLLFTTKKIKTKEDALKILDAYKKRWLIKKISLHT